MCPCQDDTDGLCLVFADLATQPGRVDAVLYRLGTIGNSLGEPDQLTVEMCPVRIGIFSDRWKLSSASLFDSYRKGK